MRAVPFLLAAVLGVAAAVLVACGGGGDRSNLIPAASADRMSSALSSVRQAVDSGNCDAAARAITRANSVLVDLPSSVDDRLVSRLRQGLDNLQTIAPRECAQQETQTQTVPTTETTTPQTTPTETTPTATTPTATTTTPTTTTTTTPTATGTTTATTTTAPPADTSGGTTSP